MRPTLGLPPPPSPVSDAQQPHSAPGDGRGWLREDAPANDAVVDTPPQPGTPGLPQAWSKPWLGVQLPPTSTVSVSQESQEGAVWPASHGRLPASAHQPAPVPRRPGQPHRKPAPPRIGDREGQDLSAKPDLHVCLLRGVAGSQTPKTLEGSRPGHQQEAGAVCGGPFTAFRSNHPVPSRTLDQLPRCPCPNYAPSSCHVHGPPHCGAQPGASLGVRGSPRHSPGTRPFRRRPAERSAEQRHKRERLARPPRGSPSKGQVRLGTRSGSHPAQTCGCRPGWACNTQGTGRPELTRPVARPLLRMPEAERAPAAGQAGTGQGWR